MSGWRAGLSGQSARRAQAGEWTAALPSQAHTFLLMDPTQLCARLQPCPLCLPVRRSSAHSLDHRGRCATLLLWQLSLVVVQLESAAARRLYCLRATHARACCADGGPCGACVRVALCRWKAWLTTTCTATMWRAWWASASLSSLPPRVGAGQGGRPPFLSPKWYYSKDRLSRTTACPACSHPASTAACPTPCLPALIALAGASTVLCPPPTHTPTTTHHHHTHTHTTPHRPTHRSRPRVSRVCQA